MNGKHTKLIEDKLDALIEDNNSLNQAMRYSLMCGGKRIRPNLLLEFFSLVTDEDVGKALPYACALEMIHTYSLIHDDLPCMDNDDFRRGKPSNHIANGEDVALLAGDALLNLAYETMLDPQNINAVGQDRAVKAAFTLSTCAGNKGMILGQVIDLANEGKEVKAEDILTMYDKKTGELLKAAALMGVQLAGGNSEQEKAALDYATNVGLSFQIVDDILDVTADEKELGKPIGSDESNNKRTYVSLMGIDKAKSEVEKLTQSAILALRHFNKDTTELKQMSLDLENRTH